MVKFTQRRLMSLFRKILPAISGILIISGVDPEWIERIQSQEFLDILGYVILIGTSIWGWIDKPDE